MPKKPDRFERVIEKHIHNDQWNMPVIYASRASKILRAEHAWMRRMVITVGNWQAEQLADDADATIAVILELLAQRRK